jgi:hypothetical protein
MRWQLNQNSVHMNVQMIMDLYTFKYTCASGPELVMECVFDITITFTQ